MIRIVEHLTVHLLVFQLEGIAFGFTLFQYRCRAFLEIAIAGQKRIMTCNDIMNLCKLASGSLDRRLKKVLKARVFERRGAK